MNGISRYAAVAALTLGMACAGIDRSCASACAENIGADWVVVQLDLEGRPFRCWELKNVSITNEKASDGIYWKDSHGNLVHISGLYNRVQVGSGAWAEAYHELGLTAETCAKVHARQVNFVEERAP